VGAVRILRLLSEEIREEPLTVHQLVCRTGLDNRTIKKYLNLLIDIQNMPKIVKEEVGLRVTVRKAR